MNYKHGHQPVSPTMTLVVFAFLLILTHHPACANNAGGMYTVYPDGSGFFATIQEAVDAAPDGQVITLADGVFTGVGNRNILIIGKDIVLQSATSSDHTTIDVEESGVPALVISDYYQYTSPTIRGITITRATSGIDMRLGNVIIRDMSFVNNMGEGIRSWLPSVVEIVGCDFAGSGITMHFDDPRDQSEIPISLYKLGDCRSGVIDSCSFSNCAAGIWETTGSGFPVTVSNSRFTGNTVGILTGELDSPGNHGFTVSHCDFINNGVAIQQPCTVVHCTFMDGNIGIAGNVHPWCQVDASHCIFKDLTTAITVGYGNYELEDCQFWNNETLVTGSSYQEDTLQLSISSCGFFDNTGGISVSADDLRVSLDATTYSRNGAPISLLGIVYTGDIGITACVFEDNVSGAIGLTSAPTTHLTVADCLFVRNGATPLNIHFIESGSLNLTNCTMSENNGSGLLLDGFADWTITKTILDRNDGYGLEFVGDGSVTLQANDAYANALGNYNGTVDPTGANGNIAADPLFCDPLDSDYHIAAISPCHPDSSTYGLIGALDVGCDIPQTFVVYPDGSGHYSTIQAAVEAAADDEVITLADGVFTGEGNRDVQIIDKNVTLTSMNGAAATTIDVEESGCPAISIGDMDTPASPTLSGIGITRASTGIRVYYGHPTFDHLQFSDNTDYAVGLGNPSSGTTFISCEFEGTGIGADLTPPDKAPLKLAADARDSFFVVDSCSFSGAPVGIQARSYSGTYFQVSNSTFQNNDIGYIDTDAIPGYEVYAYFSNCDFIANETAIIGASSVNNCRIGSGQYGVRANSFFSCFEIDSTSFSNLTAGAFRMSAGIATLTGCDFTDIHEDLVSGYAMDNDELYVTLTSCEMTDNSCGISLFGNNGQLNMADCTYSRNTAPISLSRYISGWDVDIQSCSFTECNDACHFETGDGTVLFTECVFANNLGTSLSFGGESGLISLVNNTISGSAGDGIEFRSGLENCTYEVKNTIVESSAGFGISAAPEWAGLHEANDVYRNSLGNYAGIPDPTGQDGNISAEPFFCERGQNNFHIAAISPCHPDSSIYGLIGAQDVGCDLPSSITVYSDGSGYFPTIQAAIDAAQEGQIILLADGVFQGTGNRDIRYHGKAITLASASADPFLCALDGGGSLGRGLVFDSAETHEAMLRDITVTNFTETQGAAIIIDGASPTIEGCIFSQCVATNKGGALAVVGGADPIVVGCTFVHNEANTGGAAYCLDSNLTMDSCTLVANTCSSQGGAGLHVRGGQATLHHTIIALSPSGQSISCVEDPHLDINCCNFSGNADGDWVTACLDGLCCGIVQGAGNLSQDPLFCDPTFTRNFALMDCSPCLPPHSCGTIGAWGAGCECAYSDVGTGPDAEDAGDSPVLALAMGPCTPSPFSNQTTIELALPSTLADHPTTLIVFDINGRKVRTLLNGDVQSGRFRVVWDGTDSEGLLLEDGCYFLRLSQGETTITCSAIILK